VLPLSLGLESASAPQILCIGAHCDDIEIGCGGTVLSLQRRYPGCRIHWLVLTSTPNRRSEAAIARKSFVAAAARGNVWIGELPDGFLPAHFQELKTTFEVVRRTVEPDLILTHHGRDRHQDHSLVSEMTWQTFRNHMIWEYEIPKYDGDLATPNLYVPMPAALASRKVERIMRVFASQADKSWFSAENLLAMMRLRGLESRSPGGYAEAFHGRKLVFDPGRWGGGTRGAGRGGGSSGGKGS
jgi:LmbE family N-acetylglucosaminyl deacetylase